MTHPFASRRRTVLAAATVAALAVTGLAAGTSYAVAQDSPPVTAGPGDTGAGTTDFDVNDTAAAQVAAAKRDAIAQDAPATTQFLAGAPDTTVLDLDGGTGTVRWQARLDGFLTGPSTRRPAAVALGYVRSHHDELGLSLADLDTFHLNRDYRDITGVHHLYFQQRVNGHTVFRNGLTAAVNRHGRLLMVGGSPVSASAKAAGTTTQEVTTPDQALAEARGPVAEGADTSQDSAAAGVFVTPQGLRPAWQTVTMSSADPAVTVIDADTGRVLHRSSLVDHESRQGSKGSVFRYFPRARDGGRQVTVNFTKHHWLGARATILSGNNAHAYADVDDNNRAAKSEEVHPRQGHAWTYPLRPFHLTFAKKFCGNPWPCSWNPNQRFSWRTNLAQNATQVFYFVNNWHDHLAAAPIGFTEAAGNFQLVNHSRRGKGGDPVTTETDDGADTGRGLPDGAHIDNANMATPPDGHRPRMQMYLQHMPHTSYPGGDPFSPTNVGDEADTVYHEYTHGLSNRLVVDVQGRSTLGFVQAGAMGEGWSDWYAMDYLVRKGLAHDRPDRADVVLFPYDGQGVKLDRTEPMDCKVGPRTSGCRGGKTGHGGGYTYADYGDVIGFAEVHGDSEIWSQTLWALRSRLGSAKTEALVTRAMELAPYNPSFLDMRNAILLADASVFQAADQAAIWSVFASRGMGFYAGSINGNDGAPGADFSTPPADLTGRTITGHVSDASNGGAPLAGVTVTLAFQGEGAVNPAARTDAAGNYAITGVPAGVYPKIRATKAGYQAARSSVTVGAGGGTADFSLHLG
jgi:extracellular elastinolytic metalloproteinase